MTLGEAIQAAKNGDVNAMMAVGQYYIDNNQVSEAIEYIEMAGEEGVAKAMLMAMPLRVIMAQATKDLGDLEGSIKHYEKIYYWSRYIINIGDTSDAGIFTEEDYQMAYEYGLNALFDGGVAYFFLGRLNDALDASEGLQNIKLQVLHGLALFNIATNDSELHTAFQELQIVEKNDFYVKGGFCDNYDDMIVAMAAQSQALMYREGITGTQDLGTAYNILKLASDVIKSPKAKAQVDTELAHYKPQIIRGRLGGYRYS